MWCALNIPVLAMLWLHRTLTQAAITAGVDAVVPGAVNVALPGAKLLVPGVVVVGAGAVGETATRLPCAAALAMVEVVCVHDGDRRQPFVVELER